MSKIELAELLQQDIIELKEIFDYKKYGLSEDMAKIQARGIFLNLQDHLEELIKTSVN